MVKIYHNGEWREVSNAEASVDNCYNPNSMVIKSGSLFALSGISEELQGDPFLFYDTHTTLIRCEGTVSVRTASARSAGVVSWGNLSYNGVTLPPVYGFYCGCYTEDAPVSCAWNSGTSGLFMRFHSAFAISKLIKFTVTLYFNRSVLVTAGILNAI